LASAKECDLRHHLERQKVGLAAGDHLGLRVPDRTNPEAGALNVWAEEIKELTKKADIEDFRPHDLRRWASAHANGVVGNPFWVERYLDHEIGGVAGTYNLHEYAAEKTYVAYALKIRYARPSARRRSPCRRDRRSDAASVTGCVRVGGDGAPVAAADVVIAGQTDRTDAGGTISINTWHDNDRWLSRGECSTLVPLHFPEPAA
jgi:hypothetical protein